MLVKFLDQAKEDLAKHNRHYRTVGGAALANKMLARIKKPITALKANPLIAPRYEIAPGVHRMVVAGGVFLVFYRVFEVIEVIHIRRAEREPATAEELDV